MKRLALTVVYALLVAAVSSCSLTQSQVIKTRSFGSATASIGKFGEEEFTNIRNGIIEMNKELVAIDNTKKVDSLKFDKTAPAEDTARRVAACKALKSYGELLVMLVTEDRTENLQQAAGALVTNMSTALNKELSDKQVEALNGIIAGLGSFWVEKKKADAAKTLILAYEETVNELALLLENDFSLDAGSLGYLKGYYTTANRLRNASMRLVNAGDRYSVLERARAVGALVVAEKAITRATELDNKAKTSIAALKKANAELVKAMSDDTHSTDDIKIYAKKTQDLVNMFQVLSN